MKIIGRILVSAMLCVSILAPFKSAVAGDINKTKARQVGAYFLAAQFGNKAITSQSLNQVYEFRNEERDIATLYVFNTADNRGFVIVAGTDCVDPIVAYSTEGAFDPNNIPPAMMWWLNCQAEPISYAQNNHLEPLSNYVASWKELENEALPYFGTDSKAIIKLTTSTWNQEPLYNNMCPIDPTTNQRSVTGCVATAMAQILYYWKYPRVGKKTSVYSWEGRDISVNFAEAYYDYDNMVDALSYSSTQQQINAVALLSYHCGVAVKMNYHSAASGANSEDVPKALYRYFKYEEDSLQMLSRSDGQFYNPNCISSPNDKDTLWVNTIKKEIMNKRPVYYSGASPNSQGEHSRHAFVCDGWNSVNKQLHFNWGWGGSGDCFCNVFRAQLQVGSYNFTNENKIIIGITPPADSLTTVGITTVEEPAITEVYPNPAKEQITVSYHLNGNSSADMQIFDIAGREVKRTKVYSASNIVTISVSDLRPGVYICRLQGHSSKFIVK